MPYLDSPGSAIHHRGRYGAFMAEPIEDFESPRACAEARLRDGADRLKLIATGIIDFTAGRVTAPPQMRAQEIAEIVAVAAASGRQTFAHASSDDGIDEAIDGGMLAGRLEILADGDEIDTGRSHVVHDLHDFFAGFAKANHDT